MEHAEPRWKHDGVRVIKGDQLDANTPQTPGMFRQAAIDHARVGAQKIWAGTVRIEPDAKTGVHHHGALESVIFVVRGQARMRWGRAAGVCRRGGARRFHLRAALCAAPGDQRRSREPARMRSRSVGQQGRGGQHHRCRPGGKTRSRLLGRSDPQTSVAARPSPACGRRWPAGPDEGKHGPLPHPSLLRNDTFSRATGEGRAPQSAC